MVYEATYLVLDNAVETTHITHSATVSQSVSRRYIFSTYRWKRELIALCISPFHSKRIVLVQVVCASRMSSDGPSAVQGADVWAGIRRRVIGLNHGPNHIVQCAIGAATSLC